MTNDPFRINIFTNGPHYDVLSEAILSRGKIVSFNSLFLKRPIWKTPYGIFPAFLGNQFCVRTQNLTNNNINGTSIKTPTTVASAAPDDNP